MKEKTGAKVRGIELSLLQRCGAHLASETDIEEAVMAGRAAVENAVAGITDKMVAFERETVDGHYVCKTKLLPLTSVANFEKKIPIEWINDSHNASSRSSSTMSSPSSRASPSSRRRTPSPVSPNSKKCWPSKFFSKKGTDSFESVPFYIIPVSPLQTTRREYLW